MALLDPIFNYCERTAIGLMAEPLNAVSNLAFFIAAWLLWKLYKTNACQDRQAAILIFLVALVGLGSTLFHTFANKLTMLGDVIPIGIFTFYYFWLALRRLVGLDRLKTVVCLVIFTLIASQMGHVPDAYKFNGSISYFPCLAAILVIGALLQSRKHPAAPYLLKAGALFAISLTFRSVDMTLCSSLPIGTHFLWHSLNGVVLYLLTRPIIRVK